MLCLHHKWIRRLEAIERDFLALILALVLAPDSYSWRRGIPLPLSTTKHQVQGTLVGDP